MNSYPIELLAQLAPVMFVAGLDPALLASPPQAEPSPPTTPSTTTSAKPQDAFSTLCLRLREAFLAQPKAQIWQPERSKSFQVILVDKDVRFPPRKLVPPDDPQYSSAHSSLSPLTPSSPLYPDGLIAPIWVRKHTTLLPGVFVLFLRIFEAPATPPRSPLDLPDPEKEKEREQEERRRDTALSAEVAARKRSTAERNIKLTVVLVGSRKMLDDPTLDTRLAYIRRQSGLDPRASLFLLSPVSPAEIGEFIKSLQQALYEPALEYYVAHSKRVRRKRNRHSQAASSYSHTSIVPAGAARPLRPEGWTVRYEYKMACFAEFRGEEEVALKHYQDAYATLVLMFGSTAILPPRTKRWAEAKVLADCIDIKICKLYLYNNEHTLALSQHVTHIRKFADLSRGWGIGEETFEYWSWMARQQRVLAELLEQGTKGSLIIPNHRPSLSVHSHTIVTEGDALRSLGLNPSQALQHPGFYYYMAARCTELRRERFLAMLEAEVSQRHSQSPGYANEKKVDHLGIVLELYTKSYELFRKYGPTTTQGETQNHSRMTLFIAHRIAQTHFKAGKFDVAVRFFERIAKTYRKENWGSLLRPLLSTWYMCAQRLGDVELSIRVLIEMLGYALPSESEKVGELEEDLIQVLKSTVPPDAEPLVIEHTDAAPLFDSQVVFWASEVTIGEPAAFQLSLTAPAFTDVGVLPISSLLIEFSDDAEPILIRHVHSDTLTSLLVCRIDLGHSFINKAGETTLEPREVEAHLRWERGSTLVFAGTIASEVSGVLKISRLVLSIQENSWHIKIPFDPLIRRQGCASVPHWMSSQNPARFTPVKRQHHSFSIVRHRQHRLDVSLMHQAPAYLDEEYPIGIDITNADDQDLELVVDVLLQPTEIDHAFNSITLNGDRSAGLIKGVPFGVIRPGVNVLKTLTLLNTGAVGDRMIDISIQSRPAKLTTTGGLPEPVEAEMDMTETLRTLVVPVLAPLKLTFDVGYRRAVGKQLGIADMRTYDGAFWDEGDGGQAVVTVKMECVGPWSLKLERMQLIHQENDEARIVESSAHDAEMFADECLPGDEFSDTCLILLAPEGQRDLQSDPIVGPGEYEIIWRRILPNGELGTEATTHVPLPGLRPPADDVIALLSVPPVAQLHVPIMLHLAIRNRRLRRAADVSVQLEADPTDGFIVAGVRSGHVPLLLPGAEERMSWRLIPIECGHVRLPRFKVVDRRQVGLPGTQAVGTEDETEGELLKVVDVRWDFRREPGTETGIGESRDGGTSETVGEKSTRATSILVLP